MISGYVTMLKTYEIEKIATKAKESGMVNGSMIPVWKDYDEIPQMTPQFIYLLTCAPACAKGPYLHTKRRGLLTLIEGSVRIVYQEEERGNFQELSLDAKEKAIMIDIPAGIGYLIVNTSQTDSALLLNICDYAWRKDDNETVTPDFSLYHQQTKTS